ncbi:MAG: hypothetical protein AAF747_00550 [Planctomycetota bacterium]
MRRLRRWAIASAVLLLAGTSVAVVFTRALVRSAPPWWRSVDAQDPRVADLAVRLENAVVTHLTSARPTASGLAADEPWRSEDWSVAIGAPEVNAWLNARLPSWLASNTDFDQWPDELDDVQVEFRDGLVRVGVLVRAGAAQQVLSADLRPSVRPDGSVWLPAEWIHIGRLPVPASWVLGDAEEDGREYIPEPLLASGDAGDMFEVFEGLAAAGTEPIVSLGDGRQVRLLDVEPRDGRLVLTLRTERR